MTNKEKLQMPKHLRLVKQRRKIGGPWFLELGRYVYNGMSGNVAWKTEMEWDYKTKDDALKALETMPDTWGNKSYIKTIKGK